MSKVWFITGAGRGFGRQFTEAALGRGDFVAATARDLSALGGLVAEFSDAILPLELDVRDRDDVNRAVARTVQQFGRLDVVVNNAGYGLFGMVEELEDQQLRDQLEVNLFGVLNVVQAVLPTLREQGAGHIVQISTVGGILAFPGLGGYHASKWALEGLTESLAQEVAGFGIAVTLVEPGAFATDWAGSSATHASHLDVYDELRSARAEAANKMPAEFIGDPVAVGPALLKVVDAENPPLRVLFGLMPTVLVPQTVTRRLADWDEWKHVSLEANGH